MYCNLELKKNVKSGEENKSCYAYKKYLRYTTN